MVRFLCFNAHIKSHRTKRTVEPSTEAMHKALEDFSLIHDSKDSTNPGSLNSSPLLEQGDSNDCAKAVMGSSSVERGWKSVEFGGKLRNDVTCLKKSQSLGNQLYLKGRFPCESDVEDETDQGNSSDSHDQNREEVAGSSKYLGKESPSRSEEAVHSVSAQVSNDLANNGSIFSIRDQPSEKDGLENSDAPLSGEGAEDSVDGTPHSSPTIIKSCSVPNFCATSPISGFDYLARQPRSFEDLHVLGMRGKGVQMQGADTQIMREEVRDYGISKSEKDKFETEADVYNSYHYSASGKDWIMPVTGELNLVKNLQGESSVQQWNELPNKDFKIKRIEEWVNDLQYVTPLEETNELSHSNDQLNRGSNFSHDLTAVKVDSTVAPGMEVAKRYISGLSASASTAQLANHGLVVIPFLSAFVSLKVLNLSGNAIVRITAGALPRGLHMLNLSKNNISTIEGLRELTRLRILDLSYNRILRIGHGLASCSSLKELYLAGNKISEIEGLHRLLKLTVLDLRFNKISTAKGLGQLAANYNSLQAISLEGNPAQKNVGDEQLKKHLQGLLPKLAYYNRQPIKATVLKDAADRSVRLGISERGLRSEHKCTRKGSHVQAANKTSSSSTLGRKSRAVVSPKRSSKVRHLRLPPAPSGTKATINHPHHYYDFGGKLQNFKAELSIHKSRSEGTLGVI